MSALTERITEVIYGHRFDVFTRTCSCSDWMDSGPGANRVRHNHAEHVAECIEDSLGMVQFTCENARWWSTSIEQVES